MSLRTAQFRLAGSIAGLVLCLLFDNSPLLAQGQESTSSAQSAHTSSHPPPVLSTAEVTSVPSGNTVQGSGFAANLRRDVKSGLQLQGPVAFEPPSKLACADIHDDTARARCNARKAPAAFPK
jgi:hypothetical protein